MNPRALAAADRYLAEHRAEGLRDLSEFLAIPSVSTLPERRTDVRRAADFLAARLRAAGFERTDVVDTAGHPAVLAEWCHAPGRPTVLVYGHYDVQPSEPDALWTTPPFQATERDGRLYARGAQDDKGQVWMHLLAAEALLRTQGALPVNLKWFVEGEEEIGSVHARPLVEAQRERLAADAVVISDSGFFAPGVPAVAYGLRGLAALEVHVRGPRRDLHSGSFGGAVANPLHALARIIASLHDDAGRVAVPGFYDEVRPPHPDERAAIARLPHDEAAYRQDLGIDETAGEPGFTTLERVWLRPTVEVNGMWGGFSGEGSKTVLPREAHAKLTCRLVPEQDPRRTVERVRDHLLRARPAGVRVEVELRGGTPASVVPRDSSWVRTAAAALQSAFGREPVFVRMGGSIGVVPAFTEVLAAPVVLLGFGLPDGGTHAPDEYLDLGNYDRGQRALVAYWLGLGAG